MAHRFLIDGMREPDRPRRPVTSAMLKRVLAYFRPYWKLSLVVLAAILGAAVLGIFPPLFTRRLIDQAIPRHDGRLLNIMVAALILVPLVSSLLGVAQTYLSTVIGQRVMFDLRNQMYASLRRQGMRFFTHAKAGELVSRVTNDVTGVEGVVTTTLAGIASNVLTVGVTIFAMATLSGSLTLVSLAVLPLFVYPTRRVGRLRRDLASKRQARLARLSSVIEETLGVSGVVLVKTFGRDRYEQERFAGESRRLMDVTVKESVVGRWFFMVIQTFWAAAPALVWLIGGHKAITGAFSIGSIVAFTAFQARLFVPVNQLLTVHVEVQASLALFERIFEYLDLVPDVAQKPGAVALEHPAGRLAFQNVSFAYREDVPVLKDVSFSAEAGQMIALVGPSGAGKSTIATLVMRLYDPTEGIVRLDGHDLRDVTLESLADTIGVVSQDTFLFHATIKENLLYAKPDATQAELYAAATAAQIHDFVLALPEGYETLVGERGYRLSGGEKQRVAIARAVLKDPRVLVLDEATSALDTRSERLIQKALAELLRGRTALVIAHRLSTVLAADQILVIDAGRVAEHGTHEALLAKNGLYARLYREQFSAQPRLADLVG